MEVLEPGKTRKMEFDFLCPFLDCDKSFKRSCDLMVHFRVEVSPFNYKTDVRPFECHLCHKTFRRKILLNKHLARMSCVQGTNIVKIETSDLKPGISSLQQPSSASEMVDKPTCHECGRHFNSGV